jgi:TonB dependent receptor-like, beta-barrel/Carboxypeptidase regulatory-like domain
LQPGWKLVSAASICLASATAVPARAESGRLLGWVEDTHGAPVAGAVISLFGKGIEDGGLITLSDSGGRFFLPSLPAGSYVLRALWAERATAVARRVTVLPNQDSVFTLNLEEAGEETSEAPAETDDPDPLRELEWLLRHKPRSVLEEREEDASSGVRYASLGTPSPVLPELGGAVELVTLPTTLVDDGPSRDGRVPSASAVRLRGRLTDAVSWSLSGVLAEQEGTTWRAASEFLVEPGGGHMLEVGAGYGTRLLRPLLAVVSEKGAWENRSVGAVFARDSFDVGDRVTASVGARYTYVGFVDDPNHINPSVTVEVRADDGTRVRGGFAVHTLAPGGDLLTASALSTAPDMMFAVVEETLRPERVTSTTFVVERQVGATTIAAHGLIEEVDDQLVNVATGSRRSRTLHISNGPGLSTRGGGFSVAHRFGDRVTGSLTYTFGRTRREEGAPWGLQSGLPPFENAVFHDLVGRLETFLSFSDTRLVALYRINSLEPESDVLGNQPAVRNARFDVHVSQGLPFLAEMTRADWELLLAYRNLFYEPSEGALLDEMAVVDPPKQIVGGIAIRF